MYLKSLDSRKLYLPEAPPNLHFVCVYAGRYRLRTNRAVSAQDESDERERIAAGRFDVFKSFDMLEPGPAQGRTGRGANYVGTPSNT